MKKRVKIPMQDPKALLDLVKKVREKHVADGDASPLKVMNWTTVNTMIDEALHAEDRAMQLKREQRKAFQDRSHKLTNILAVVRNSRDILTGVHNEQMKVLGLWGFDVLDKRVRIPNPAEASTETKVEKV